MILVSCLLAATISSRAEGAATVPFQVGEKLTYQVYWGPFIAGRASLEVQGIERVDGHDCYHLVALARTSGLADLLYHIDNTSESWLDVNQLFTRRYREDRTEGNRPRRNQTVYDYDRKQATTTNLINNKASALALDHPVQDVISALYYVRVKPLATSISNSFLINAGGSNYNVNVCPDLRKTLWIRPLGDVAALRIEPKPTLNVVAANKGRMWFWLSDDNRRFPLLVVSDMKIGSARLVLFKVESDARPTNAEASTTSNFGPANPEFTTSKATDR